LAGASINHRTNRTVSAVSCNLRESFLGLTMMYEFAWLTKICLKRCVGSRQSVSATLRVMFPQEKTSVAGKALPPRIRPDPATIHRFPLRVAISDGWSRTCRRQAWLFQGREGGSLLRYRRGSGAAAEGNWVSSTRRQSCRGYDLSRCFRSGKKVSTVVVGGLLVLECRICRRGTLR
jgi:hypothetical protein